MDVPPNVPDYSHAMSQLRIIAIANSLFEALRSPNPPPQPQPLTLLPGEMTQLIMYSLKRKEWKRHTSTIMRLISTAMVPMSWPVPGLPSFKAVAGDASNSGVCGKVWKEDDLAYKCKTCERDPTCVVCVQCFRHGDHEGHDFAMVRTAGGCCDCGDVQAWKQSGFCTMHSGACPEYLDPSSSLPPTLRRTLSEAVKAVAAAILSMSAVLHVRMKRSVPTSTTVSRVTAMLDWLRELVQCGDGFRRAVGVLLTSKDSLTWLLPSLREENVTEQIGLNSKDPLDSRVSWLTLMLRIDGVDRLPERIQASLHAVYFQLITDLVFKRIFLEKFVENYERYVHAQVARKYNLDKRGDEEDDRRPSTDIVENFTVQLFTVPALVPVMIRKGGLLDVLITLLQRLLETLAAPVRCYDTLVPLAESAYAQKHPEVVGKSPLPVASSAMPSSPAPKIPPSRIRHSLPISHLIEESANRSFSGSVSSSSASRTPPVSGADSPAEPGSNAAIEHRSPSEDMDDNEVLPDNEAVPVVHNENDSNPTADDPPPVEVAEVGEGVSLPAQGALPHEEARSPQEQNTSENSTPGVGMMLSPSGGTSGEILQEIFGTDLSAELAEGETFEENIGNDPSAEGVEGGTLEEVFGTDLSTEDAGGDVQLHDSEEDHQVSMDEDELTEEDAVFPVREEVVLNARHGVDVLVRALAEMAPEIVQLAEAIETDESVEEDMFTQEMAEIEPVDSNNFSLFGGEAEEGSENFSLQQLAVFEESVSFTPAPHIKILSSVPPPNDFRAAVTEARAMASAAADGSGTLAHPMRLNWSRNKQMSMNVIYSRVMIDLKYLLCHPCVAYHLIHEREDLFRTFVRIISIAQGMNPQSRRFGDHVIVEGDTWSESFKLEMEIYHFVELVAVAFCENNISPEGKTTYVPKPQDRDVASSRLRAIGIVRTCLDEWLEREAVLEELSTYAGETFSVAHSVSVHLPLHRFLGLLVHHAIAVDDVDLKRAITGDFMSLCSEDNKSLLSHPLRIQVFLAQVRAGMWKRNGHPVVGQSMLYRSIFCSEWYVDLDLFVQQCCAVLIGPESFISEVQDAFRIGSLSALIAFCYSETAKKDGYGEGASHGQNSEAPQESPRDNPRTPAIERSEQDHDLSMERNSSGLLPLAPRYLERKGRFELLAISAMGNSDSELAKFSSTLVEEFILFLVRVTCERTRCGQNEKEFLKRKLLHQLCSRDRTYSQLNRACSYRICSDLYRKEGVEKSSLGQSRSLFETTLGDIAEYVEPKGMEEGKYCLKGSSWAEFDQFSSNLSPRERCASEVRHGVVCKRQRTEMMVIPQDKVSDRRTYQQFADLKKIIVNLCASGIGIATVMIRENISRNKGSHSIETALSAALHLICASVEFLSNSCPDPSAARWLASNSKEESFSEGAIGAVCNMVRVLSDSQNGLYVEFEPVLRRILVPVSACGDEKLKMLLVANAPRYVSQPASSSSLQCSSTMQKLSPEEERKVILQKKKKEQQAAAMARIRLAQESFAKHISSSVEEEEETLKNICEPSKVDASTGNTEELPIVSQVQNNTVYKEEISDSVKDNHKDTSLSEKQQDARDVCALCHESGSADGTRLIGLIGFHQPTRLPGIALKRFKEQPSSWKVSDPDPSNGNDIRPKEKHMVLSEENGKDNNIGEPHNSSEILQSTTSTPSDHESTTELKPFLLNEHMLEKGVEAASNLHISFCGHALHITCFESYFRSLLQSRANLVVFEGNNVLNLERIEFLCPACRRLANMVLPLMYNIRRNPNTHGESNSEDSSHMSFNGSPFDFVKWKELGNGDIGSSRSLAEYTTDADDKTESGALATAERQNEQKREIVSTVAALSMSIIRRGKEVLNRFGLQAVHSSQRSGESSINDSEREQLRFDSYAELAAAAISTVACAEIAARSDPWEGSTFQQTNRSLGHVLREARAQIHLEPDSRVSTLRLLWKKTTNDKTMRRLDPFSSFSYLFLLWPDPLNLFEVKNLICMGLDMLFRQSEKRRKDGNETSIDAIMDALLYLRRVGVLVSSYYSMSQPPPLFTYSHSQNESSEYNAKKEMGLLMTYFDIPWSFISEYIDGITLHRESRTVVTSLNFQPIRIGLIQLPELFQLLLEKLDGETCTGCSIVPKRTALCLVCGAVLCYGSEGCRADSAHSKECGAGIGVYLVLNNTRVQIIRNDRSTRWGSPYLDVHGEEDQALSRGKPLFLNKERYAVLEQLWLFHRFDQDSRILGFTQRARVNAL